MAEAARRDDSTARVSWVASNPRLAAKRRLDVAVSSVALAITSPLLLLLWMAIRSRMGAPVLFRQQRPGYRGESFELLKFRTMRPPQDAELWFRSDEDRLTRLGRLMRRLSLDELPSLWNVLRGDMSLVGPRPLLVEYLPKYTTREARRHEMPPGVTGWAQVNGRQTIPFSKRLELDVWYVENWSFRLDLKIIWMTFSGVVRGHGVISGQAVDEVDDIGLSPDVDRKLTVEEGIDE